MPAIKYSQPSPAILLLEDGTAFKGNAIGKTGITSGEICFNTGMTGYQEIFTDPSYYGQILVMTTSHIGNYGVHSDETESEALKIAGLVTRNFSFQYYSRPSGKSTLQELFEKEGVIGISDVDTRSLVRHIRDKGAMNAIISSQEQDIVKLNSLLSKVPLMKGLELSSRVSTKRAYNFGSPYAAFRVAVLDLGVKKNILRCLGERGCYLKVYPHNTTVNEILGFEPAGIMLSNGPGDPSAMTSVVKEVKKMLDTGIPVFGICLGHQVLALACGLSTYKMHIGHRGVNHPVKNIITGKCEVTSQNHGFSVNTEDAKKNKNIEVTHIHLNDSSLAGIRLKNKKAFSVQYHPESSAGPNDSRYLFDEFINNIKSFINEKELEAVK